MTNWITISLALIGVWLYVNYPYREENDQYKRYRQFGILLIVAAVGYFLYSRRTIIRGTLPSGESPESDLQLFNFDNFWNSDKGRIVAAATRGMNKLREEKNQCLQDLHICTTGTLHKPGFKGWGPLPKRRR